MLAEIVFKKSKHHKRLRLFDTFEGMPDADSGRDLHKRGDFSDTSLAAVKDSVRHDNLVSYYPGFIPDTFQRLEDSKIALAHVDVDTYQSVLDCSRFIYPRLSPGGFIIFDDYAYPSCPGARGR
jgi:O-methyltransferase